MTVIATTSALLEEGTLSFTIESRIIRELGERLVKQPEVALLELVKNAYDADAKVCEITYEHPGRIVVDDDGHGMTLEEFKEGWMRIGTSSKEAHRLSRTYDRIITGEKGIGRFAVRFLGKALHLESVAWNQSKKFRTLLVADFDWPVFDNAADLGKTKVPYRLLRAQDSRRIGTRLSITSLRPSSAIDLRSVRTASLSVVTPYHSLLQKPSKARSEPHRKPQRTEKDPGFALKIQPASDGAEDGNVARAVLDNFVLRAVLELTGNRLELSIYRRGEKSPANRITDNYLNSVGPVYADIRFFPQRKGTFVEMGVDGRTAKTWVKEHSGVAVFDRDFRVHPYGTASDDWLRLAADRVKSGRDPRSSLAKKYFPMDEPTRKSTQLNYMLRLPYPQQLVGIAQVEGRRTQDQKDDEDGLIPAADREGFVDNAAFAQLFDIVRGAVEAIASEDRELQQEEEEAEQEQRLESLREEARQAIKEIQANPNIARNEKLRIVKRLVQTQELFEQHEERTHQREEALGVMSLLGVVAGFMTHEFGAALSELQDAQRKLAKLARRDESFKAMADGIAEHLTNLQEFVMYSQGYIQGASTRPERRYAVRPRIQQVKRIFGKYAEDRSIAVNIEVGGDLLAPLVPVSLYNGIALNLFSNALKAVTAKGGKGERQIVFRAWNEQQSHHLEVSDTGIGIPTALRDRVFDPLFTTTGSNQDPLGSGMGLGLSLVKRGIEAYGGRVDVIAAPPGFTTCVSVRLPLGELS